MTVPTNPTPAAAAAPWDRDPDTESAPSPHTPSAGTARVTLQSSEIEMQLLSLSNAMPEIFDDIPLKELSTVSYTESSKSVSIVPEPALPQHMRTSSKPISVESIDLKRSWSDSSVTHIYKSRGTYMSDPREWMPGYVASNIPPQSHRPSGSALQHLEDTAETLGIEKPQDVPKMIKNAGISPWAAVLALSTPTVVGDEPVSKPRSLRESTGDTILAEVNGIDTAAPGSQSISERKKSTRKESRRNNGDSVDGTDEEEVEVEADENVRRNFLLKLSRTFSMYGAPSHRLEFHLAHVAKALDIDADFILFPGLLLVSFGGTENYNSTTHFLKAPWGINMGKLAQVNALCLALIEGLIDVHSAVDLLEGVRAASNHPNWVILLTFPMASFCVSLLLFQLSWLESIISGFLGLVVGLITEFLGRFENIGFLLEFLSTFVSTFLSRSIQSFLPGYCFNYLKITLASIAIFLPGLTLTIAIIELSTRNMVSGTVRLFGALFVAMVIGFGLTIGGSLVLWDTNPAPHPEVCPQTSQYWGFLFFIPMSMSINLAFQGSKFQWPIMVLASAMGFATNTLLNMVPGLQAQPTAVTALSSFSIGVTANVYARVTNDVAIAPILAGLLIQVPGSLSVTSTLKFFQSSSSSSSIVDGVNFTFQMLTISMALAMGLFLATLIVWPIRGPKSKYLTI